MTKNHRGIIRIAAKRAPVVELDSAAHAAYVRFSRAKVAKTIPVDTEGCTVTIDVDDKGAVIGVELIGVDEFGIKALLKKLGVSAPDETLRKTQYVPAKSEAVA